MISNWLSRHQRVADFALLAGVAVATLAFSIVHRHENAAAVPLAVCTIAPLIVWRRRPLAVLAIVTALGVFTFAIGDTPFPVPVGVALYAVASLCERRVAIIAGLSAFAVTVLASLASGKGFGGGISVMVFFAAAWLFGEGVASRRAYVREIEKKADRLEREHEAHALRAAAEEQARIARELHDIVAHSVSVIVVQASAADDVFESDRAQAREALRAIESSARSALGDLRRVLGTLRDEVDYRPQPGLDRLPALVDDVRATGLEVALTVEGMPRPLPAAVDLSAYRIVQEALTNTLRHAAARRAEVRVTWGDELGLEILDDGRGAGDSDAGAGQGLIGMRERAMVLGGSVTAGPAFGGGYAVSARIPIDGIA